MQIDLECPCILCYYRLNKFGIAISFRRYLKYLLEMDSKSRSILISRDQLLLRRDLKLLGILVSLIKVGFF